MSPSSGRYCLAGASRSSLPSSTSCSATVPVIALVVEKIAMTVSVVISSPVSRSRLPAAPRYVVPARSVTPATTPGTPGEDETLLRTT